MDNKDRRKLIKDLNDVITCRLCEGYLVDATALTECFHVFCRSCILRHFENSKTGCPTCNTIYKKKSQTCFRDDPQTQSLVYKVVPGLFAKECQRREDFYRSTGVRASSSCSDDSVIERERDMINDQEEMISNCFGNKTQFFSSEDSISLSLEYYQSHLDTTDKKEENPKLTVPEISIIKPTDLKDTSAQIGVTLNNTTDSDSGKNSDNDKDISSENDDTNCDKRFLQCPAGVSMRHLQKFIRMKFGLTADHRVDIIYKGEVLKIDFSLMDVAYTFKWTREKPMRFFYRIFTPQKIRPIKIRLEGEQLQIVPVKPNSDTQRSPNHLKEEKPEVKHFLDETEDQRDNKKRLLAHLQLQPSQTEREPKKVPEKVTPKDCIYEYQEPDQEEIKRFAEKRDREWALQKKLDEESKRKDEEDYGSHHISKKRKKSKHSKNEFNSHKKRKLHAEIASNEEDLKLKVKITNNGHKHKHHKSSGQFNEKDKNHSSELSSKEKLLQMRQVRHKHVLSEDKNIQTVPSLIISKDTNSKPEKPKSEKPKSEKPKPEKPKPEKPKAEKPKPEVVQNFNTEPKILPIKISEDIKKLKIKVPEPSTKVTESAILPKQQTQPTSTSPKVGTFLESSSPNKPAFIKAGEKEWEKKVPTVHLERNEQTEKQAQKTQFLKTFYSFPDKHQRNEKKIESAKLKLNVEESKTENNKITTNNKSLDMKIENLRQRCTIEPKQPEKVEKKISFNNTKNKILTQCPPGFTVSKVEQGFKRKHEDNVGLKDKRPSLEITLINPPSNNPVQITPKPVEKLPVKRPPPPTIPLEKIKKSVNLKSGISIIPKMPERCDNIGALDLSNKSPEPSPRNSPKIENTNGLTITTNRQLTALRPDKNVALSNLQMLSKVATEHPNLNNKQPQNNIINKPRAPMPSLQTLKIPTPIQMKTPNLQKLPKLNEIQKFRPTNAQIRNLRPNQNQNIRNIPNPSALIRQHQTQSRLNITGNQVTAGESSTKTNGSTPVTSVSSVQKEATLNVPKTMDIKVQEKKEISV